MTTCKEEARRWVHRYAAGGAAFAALPIVGSSAALATLEMHMVGIIGDIYGESVSGVTTAAAGGTFGVIGQGLKWIAFRGTRLIPGYGALVRVVIAAAAVEVIGYAIVEHFERKYPGKLFVRMPPSPPAAPTPPSTTPT
jgi:uncharacterized protein (DUF697 family)